MSETLPWIQRVDDSDKIHEAGHKRLREDLEKLVMRVSTIESQLPNLERRATILEQPVDVSKLRIQTRDVIGIVVVCLTIASSVWASTSGLRTDNQALRSDVRDIITRMQAQSNSSAAETKLQDERMANMQRAINDVKAQQTMQDLQIRSLRELVVSNQTTRSK